jgi:hypothetical protein
MMCLGSGQAWVERLALRLCVLVFIVQPINQFVEVRHGLHFPTSAWCNLECRRILLLSQRGLSGDDDCHPTWDFLPL